MLHTRFIYNDLYVSVYFETGSQHVVIAGLECYIDQAVIERSAISLPLPAEIIGVSLHVLP